MRFRLVAGAVLAAALTSCSLDTSPGPAVIWTDAPEVALYSELFNQAQSRYRVDVRWKDNLAVAIRDADIPPDLAIGRYLKSSIARDRFQSLDYLFGELTVNQAAFYPGLLNLGNTGGRQLLLPLSFDLPVIVYAQGGSANPAGKAILGLEDMASAAGAWNQKKSGSFTRMGFAPRWDPDFLVYVAAAFGSGFREGRPIAWNEAGLDGAVARLRSWTEAANGSAIDEEDFKFKYLYTPAYKYIVDGRALYASMRAKDLFLVPAEKRIGLDYRWYGQNGAIPVAPDVVFAAIPRLARDKPAAEAFLKWFYRDDNQRAMLENARRSRAMEGSFGIAGGFSAVRSVTERIFPAYYPNLVDHLPPADALSVPGVLPDNWPDLQARLVEPWLLESSARSTRSQGRPGDELAAALAAWNKNQGH